MQAARSLHRNLLHPVVRPLLIYMSVALLVGAGIWGWDRAARRPAPDPLDPAVRARAAAQSITGEQTVRRVLTEPGAVTVQARSKYYSPQATASDNRQYLATEGRLIVQLILHDVPTLALARVELFSGRQRLAVITGGPHQAIEQYKVIYDASLAGPKR